jgi:hypothetical protein
MNFGVTCMLLAWRFWIFALAMGNGQCSKKHQATSNKSIHTTQKLVFVMVGIISARIS